MTPTRSPHLPEHVWLDADGVVRCVWCGGVMAMLTKACECTTRVSEADPSVVWETCDYVGKSMYQLALTVRRMFFAA